MKKYILIFFVILFGLTACTLLVDELLQAEVVSVEHQADGTLLIYLRNVEEGSTVTVNGLEFDCQLMADNSGILECRGPGFEPGKELVIKIFDKEGNPDPDPEISAIVPDYPEGQDSDGDGLPDTEDGCPGNPDKDQPGKCGCGVPETDQDGDGTPDCVDACPDNPELTQKGDNGCDSGPADSDQDGVADDDDKCPQDPDKDQPGVCGCGAADVDTDQDGTPDCEDACPEVAYADKVGDPCDKDEDDDGVFDGGDMCPYDPEKYDPGYCGCDQPETDRDGDGYPDCVDACPDDENKIEPGKCGCGTKDKDTDKDGVPDCKDKCPTEPNDKIGDPCDHDEDCDGCKDWDDACPFDKYVQDIADLPCGPPISFCP